MASDTPTLTELAAKVQALTQTFTQYLEQNKIPQPTFAASSPTNYANLDSEAFLLRQTLFDTLMDMIYLTQGPSESIFNYAHTVGPDTSALGVLNHFDFWAAVPLDGSASYADLEARTKLPAEICRRFIEHACTLRIFSINKEKEEGEGEDEGATTRVRHTSRSAALAKSPGLRALVSTVLDDAGPPLSLMPETLRRYMLGKSVVTGDQAETAFALLHGGSGGPYGRFDSSWDFLENEGIGERKGWRQRNFATFMRYVNDIFQFDTLIAEGYDWRGAGDIRVIDVGGSGGHDAIALAQKFPNLTITVQDLGQAQAVFDTNLPADLKPRVFFQPHNFLHPQPAPADVYLMKLILHDWTDDAAVAILRNLTPGMRPGSKLLFIDYVGKKNGAEADDEQQQELPRSLRAFGTATDIRMMALFNHRERLADEWTDLFRRADKRFEITRVRADPVTFVLLMEVTWRA